MVKARNIDESIHKLLYDHDCVIVPNFGGFVGVYKPAQILPKGNKISPPSKRVSFNNKLQNNDGILANYIAKTQGISFESAMERIALEVKDSTEELKVNKRLEIIGVGVIYIDKESNYRFIPNEEANFLKSSFGLDSLFIEKVKKEETKVIPIHSNEKPSKSRKWIAAVLIPVFLAGAYVVNMAVQNDQFSVAGLNPFQAKAIISADYIPSTPAKKAMESQSESLESIVSKSSESTINYSFVEGAETKLMVIEVPEKVEVPVKAEEIEKFDSNEVVEVKKETTLENYNATGWFIVGGAFREYPNAQKMVRILRSEGHGAFIFGKSGSLHLVCVEQFQTKKEAKLALSKIKSEGRKEVWLKRK